ncbi:MAG TPA: FHA domain-containing protein, partial [Thermoanaerobaculia bacterium]|nr:FHA domain-containing protein [Thermoanaerobaculia bacterium]
MDRLAAIDTATLDDLARIKEEEEALLARLDRLEQRRAETSPAVFARIEGDYRGRLAELAEEARPLKERAAHAFRELAAVLESLAAELEAARLDREEQEVRHEVGELDEAAFAARLAEVEGALAEREGLLAEAEALRGRFLAAVRDDAELEIPATATEPPPPLPELAELAELPAPVPPPFAAGVETVPSAEGITRPFATPEPPAPEGAAEPEIEDDGTVILPRRVAGGAIAGSHTATLMIPPARIVCQEPGYEEEYLLGPSTLVGRTFECQVRIPHAALSRRHARIDLLPDGAYALVDLGSENGTLVNGERVSERRLANGDQLQLGTLCFLFRVG